MKFKETFLNEAKSSTVEFDDSSWKKLLSAGFSDMEDELGISSKDYKANKPSKMITFDDDDDAALLVKYVENILKGKAWLSK